MKALNHNIMGCQQKKKKKNHNIMVYNVGNYKVKNVQVFKMMPTNMSVSPIATFKK